MWKVYIRWLEDHQRGKGISIDDGALFGPWRRVVHSSNGRALPSHSHSLGKIGKIGKMGIKV